MLLCIFPSIDKIFHFHLMRRWRFASSVCFSVGGEEFLEKLRLHLGPIMNGPWSQGVEPNISFVFQCEGKKLEPH